MDLSTELYRSTSRAVVSGALRALAHEAPAARPRPGECCATCGRKVPITKARIAPAAVDTATMTEAELYAHYKRTAPAEDVRFALKHDLEMPADLRAEWEVLAVDAASLPAAETRRRLYRLHVRRWDFIDARTKARRLARWARIAELTRIQTHRVRPMGLDPARIPAAGATV
jgi:hypothetical protein